MKLNKLCIAALLVAGTVGVSSCKEDFLNETQITQHDTEYFKTQEGIDALVTGAYQTLKFRYEYQWAYKMWHMGVDEFTGGNNDMADYNHYSSALNSTQGDLATVWNTYYGLIEQANIVIQNVPLYYSQSNSNYNIRLGEGYFLRAYGYFELVKLFGGVCLKLEPSTSVETYFTRDSEENCYKQIISDFEQAYSLLPTSSLQTGRILKTAAAHFLAKAHLFRASEANDSWNSSYKSSDLEAVIKYAKYGFAKHRIFTDIDALNQDCLDWLERTGNAEEHGTTKKIPAEVFAIEKDYLIPVSEYSFVKPTDTSITYQVRKDNVVLYKSNRYRVPKGTYKEGKKVFVIPEGDSISIVDAVTGVLYARHPICTGKGELIGRSSRPYRDKSKTILELEKSVIELLGEREGRTALYLSKIHREKQRYYRDQLGVIKNLFDEWDAHLIKKALDYCIDQELYSAGELSSATVYMSSLEDEKKNKTILHAGQLPEKYRGGAPKVRDLRIYEDAMERRIANG